MSAEALGQPPQYAERDLLSAIAILQALLARPGQSDERRARWRASLNRARRQLEVLRAGEGETGMNSRPAGARAWARGHAPGHRYDQRPGHSGSG